MSVDPLIQAPTSTQSINSYSYIMNNPLAGTDPTGYAADCDSEGNNCNVGDIPVEKVENIQQHEDGTIIVNTTDGESYKVDNGTNSSVDVGLDLSANTATGKNSDGGDKGKNPVLIHMEG